jgi:hypothetical protein
VSQGLSLGSAGPRARRHEGWAPVLGLPLPPGPSQDFDSLWVSACLWNGPAGRGWWAQEAITILVVAVELV